MTTQAPLDFDARRSAARPVADVPDAGPERPAASSPHPSLGLVPAGMALGAMAVAGATAVGLRWASRPAAPKTITMGPGGWVSFKGLQPPPVGPPRPWWAVLLRAQRRT